jgi:hypothetical protein
VGPSAGGSERTSVDDRTELPQESAAAQAPPPRHTRSLTERLNTWVPMVTAVAALALSVVTWAQSQRTPEVTMNLPSIIRIGAESPESFDVYLQPSFSVPRSYDSTARISAVQFAFSLEGAVETRAPNFYWHDSGIFGQLDEGGFGWTYASDPAPFIVGHQEPQRPTIRFIALDERISPGHWTGSITAARGPGQEALVERFCVVVSEANILDYTAFGIIDFRNDIPNAPTDCYWRPDDW